MSVHSFQSFLLFPYILTFICSIFTLQTSQSIVKMKMIFKILPLIFLISPQLVDAQTYVRSKTSLAIVSNSVVPKKLYNENSILFLNPKTGEFYAYTCFFSTIDPQKRDSLSNLVSIMEIVFQGDFPLPQEQFSEAIESNQINFIPGFLIINGVKLAATAEFSFDQFSPVNQQMSGAFPNTDLYAVNMNFSLQFSPSDFELDQPPYNLKNDITLEIRDGVLNRVYLPMPQYVQVCESR